MGYATLADLKTAIQAETARSDTAFIARLSEFVAAGEKRLYHGQISLRVKEMGKRASLTFTNGSSEAPADFLGARRLTWNGSSGGVQLKYREPEDFYATRIWGGSDPVIFTVEEDEDVYKIDVLPAESGTADLGYYAEPAALVETDDTNSVLESWGHLYLYASCIEAYRYLRNLDKTNELIQFLNEAIADANLSAVKARYAGTKLSPRIPGAYQARYR
jgi:hypothetical protein